MLYWRLLFGANFWRASFWRQPFPPLHSPLHHISILIASISSSSIIKSSVSFSLISAREINQPTMVVSLGPGKFYGSSLPRPRYYTDAKLNSDRVDPPTPVLEPLLSWANEAHWSMGGLSFKRLRLQGRIEGNVKKLRSNRSKIDRKKKQTDSKESPQRTLVKSLDDSPSPPPAPVATKRKRYVGLIGDGEEKEEGGVVNLNWRSVRNLGDDFDRVADGSKAVASETWPGKEIQVVSEVRSNNKGNKLKKKGESDEGKSFSPAGSIRVSPRLMKRRSN